MNIFILHVLADVAAGMHCDTHANKMLLEATQILYTVMYMMNIDTSVLGTKPYRKTHEFHPCTLWALACKAHAYWILDFAIALGVVRQNVYKTGHKSTEHLDAMKRTMCFDSLPATTTPAKWAKQLKGMGISDDNIKSCLSKVALKNPPNGCIFGVACVDVPDYLVDDIFVYCGTQIDLVETYRRFMVFKAKRKMSFEWDDKKVPPDEYGSLFDDIMPDEDMLTNKQVLAMNKMKREVKQQEAEAKKLKRELKKRKRAA